MRLEERTFGTPCIWSSVLRLRSSGFSQYSSSRCDGENDLFKEGVVTMTDEVSSRFNSRRGFPWLRPHKRTAGNARMLLTRWLNLCFVIALVLIISWMSCRVLKMHVHRGYFNPKVKSAKKRFCIVNKKALAWGWIAPSRKGHVRCFWKRLNYSLW